MTRKSDKDCLKSYKMHEQKKRKVTFINPKVPQDSTLKLVNSFKTLKAESLNTALFLSSSCSLISQTMSWPNEFPEGKHTHTSVTTKKKQTLKIEQEKKMRTSSHSSIDASVDLVPTSTFDTFLVFW